MPRATRKRRATTPPPSVPIPQLPPSDVSPAELLILPETCSSQSRLVLLPNPALSTPCRYLYCPETGLHELKCIAHQKQNPTSCLLSPDRHREKVNEGNEKANEALIMQDAKVIVATPVDPLFFLAPLFEATISDERRALARSLDDHMQILESSSETLKDFLQQNERRSFLENVVVSRLASAGEVDGEPLLRADPACLFKPIKQKAQRIAQKGLPTSLVAYSMKQLQAPAFISAPTAEIDEPKEIAVDEDPSIKMNAEANEIQSGTGAIDTSPSRNKLEPSQEVRNLHSFRLALEYLCQNYLPPQLHAGFQSYMRQASKVDFTPLDNHLSSVQKLRMEARALRSLSDNISRKRSTLEDDEAAEARAEKRRKKEEEEKKKKAESRAAKDLKKVDTSGMKKLSSFFVKATAT